MSFNRENVTWQSADGTWNIGFYETLWVGSEADGDDPEWDVEYGSDFWWVSIGHPSERAAHDAWDGSNPGGSIIVTGTGAAEFDAKAARVIARGERSGRGYADYSKQG